MLCHILNGLYGKRFRNEIKFGQFTFVHVLQKRKSVTICKKKKQTINDCCSHYEKLGQNRNCVILVIIDSQILLEEYHCHKNWLLNLPCTKYVSHSNRLCVRKGRVHQPAFHMSNEWGNHTLAVARRKDLLVTWPYAGKSVLQAKWYLEFIYASIWSFKKCIPLFQIMH